MPTIPEIFATLVIIVHWLIVIGLGLRIILKRRPTGVSLAWLLIVVSVPFFGAVLYLFVGELWLPKRRIQRYNAYKKTLASQIDRLERSWELSSDELPEQAQSLNAQVNLPLGISAIGGNSIRLFQASGPCKEQIVRDIDNAKKAVSMLFYIWESAGDTRLVEQALVRAAGRGVKCRVMLDSAGCKAFVKSGGIDAMRGAGISVIETLPVGVLRVLFARIDIRNHRKIITIDHDIAYTGSMNMVDPAYFHADQKVGQWIDVMARVHGPAARVLDMILSLDWAVEEVDRSDVERISPEAQVRQAGDIPLQVVPSGPDQAPRIIHDMLLTMIYNTRKRLIITTPYFIPGEAMLTALTSASMRGVAVTLVIPEHIDSLLVRHASKAYFDDLLDAGIEVRAFKGGLLHAKTVTADDHVAMLGTLNMDKRSFWINFEISLFAYDARTVQDLRELQNSYIADSNPIDPVFWRGRSLGSRIVQNSMQLLAPIL